jgi:uncharacterized damage-inducible protein DinB
MHKAQPEPWLRGTHAEIPPVPRAVVHAMELAQEDLFAWCGELTQQELNVTPFGLPSIAFQIRHIVYSIDRLLTYAEGARLNGEQLEALNTEMKVDCSRAELFAELSAVLAQSVNRIRMLGDDSSLLEEPRTVGRKSLPATLAGLLVHIADHTQRHVGQAITTAKIILAQRTG